MNPIKSNIGLIVLSISIVFSSLILSINKVTHDSYISPFIEQKLKLSGDEFASRIPLKVNSNSNDVTYYSEFKIGANEFLEVEKSNGKIESLKGENIVAKYFHVAKLLTVTFQVNGQVMIKYYTSPIKWSNLEL